MVIFFDGEYSGLDIRGGEGVLSLAAIDENDYNNIFEGECRLNIGQGYNLEAMKHNGIPISELYSNDRDSLEFTILSFFDWFKASSSKIPSLVSMNNPKDIEHLENAFEIVEVPSPLHYRNIDFHSVAHSFFNFLELKIPTNDKFESNLSMSLLAKLVNVPQEPKPHSTAINGALQTAEVYKRLVDGEKFLPIFSSYELPNYLIKFHKLRKELGDEIRGEFPEMFR